MALLKYTSKTNTDVLGMTHKRAFRKLKTISNVHDDSDTHFLCFLVYPIDCELTDGNALFPCESYCRNISSSFKYNVSEVCDMLAEKTSANEFCINERTFRRPEPSVTESQVPRPVVTHKQAEILKMPSYVTFTMPVVSLCVIMLETLIVSLALSTSIGSHQVCAVA
ncbi:hypothetical protein EB796_011624 [Bugula neritina]|uniref:FZ domain-containing protein n=1 Tax=Bugula neritina TaxID=10212 RepID=A0A7J7JVU6_BUGNE|nr:hypothetical protein EB796_011624 [Bugula neritina]